MIEQIYLQPTGFVASAGSDQRAAVRLAGGRVWAHTLILHARENGRVRPHWQGHVSDFAAAIASLPGALADDAEQQWANLSRVHPPLAVGGQTLDFSQPSVMGILNVTPDSFSDGGAYDRLDAAREHAAAMVQQGAAIIDIGGESTRPGAKPVSEREEITRVVPAIEACAGLGAGLRAVVSVDTRKAAVMQAALAAGAHIVNDVSGLTHDPRSAEIVAQAGCPVVLMHAPGAGQNLHDGGDYTDVVFDVFDALRRRRDAALAAGIDANAILLDPGIGFGKSLADNLALMNALPLFHALGCPLLLGASRKRMIAALSHDAPVTQRLGGSLALAMAGMDAGVQVLRVHDVAETAQARDVWCALRGAA